MEDRHRRVGCDDDGCQAGRPHGSPGDQHGVHSEQPFPGEQKGQVPSKKSTFNKSQPKNDQATFRGEVVNTLKVLFSLNDAAGDDKTDDQKQIDGLADILLPDVLTFDTAKSDGFLNGRKLADDVIDAELGLITEGTVKTDCVSKNDRTFRGSFPISPVPTRAAGFLKHERGGRAVPLSRSNQASAHTEYLA